MADLSLKPIMSITQRSSLPGNIAWAVFVLFCFWVGSHLLNIAAQAPEVIEHLFQNAGQHRQPVIEMDIMVSTVFGAIPVLVIGAILGTLCQFFRWRNL